MVPVAGPEHGLCGRLHQQEGIDGPHPLMAMLRTNHHGSHTGGPQQLLNPTRNEDYTWS